ncbi:MAG: hypothetical protein ABR971_10830 [Acidobacteriaceae bacterium]|jgi:hypothetical protein
MNTDYTPSTNQTKAALHVDCEALTLEAGRELAAFLDVVAQVFGSQEVKHAADRWLNILESHGASIRSPSFRDVTIQAAASLTSRWINQSRYPMGRSGEGSAARDTEFSTCATPPAQGYSPTGAALATKADVDGPGLKHGTLTAMKLFDISKIN